MNVLTRCPKQHLDYDTEEEISSTVEYKDCLVVFYDMLESKQKKFSSFTHVRLENIDLYYLSERNFSLSSLIRESSSFINLYKQTGKLLQSLCEDLNGFNLS